MSHPCHQIPDSIIIEPVPAGAFFQNVLEHAQKNCHKQHPQVVGVFQLGQIGVTDINRQRCTESNQQPGYQVDLEQPIQFNVSVIQPPIIGPSTGAIEAMVPITVAGKGAASPGNVGIIDAPNRP